MSNRFWRAMGHRDAIRRERAARIPHLFVCRQCGRRVERVHDGLCPDCRQRTLEPEVSEDDDQRQEKSEPAGIESRVPEKLESGRQGS